MTFLGIWCFLCFEMGFSLPSMWSGKWVAQIGAFYCNGWILRACESEGTGLFFLPYLSHCHRLSEKWLTPHQQMRWQAVSGLINHSGKVWLLLIRSVLLLEKYSLYNRADISSNKLGAVDLSASPLRVTSHTPTSLHIYLAWILAAQLKTSLPLYSWPCVIYWVALLTLGITQRVIIDSHMDKHFLQAATLGRSHQAAFPLTTVCRTQ